MRWVTFLDQTGKDGVGVVVDDTVAVVSRDAALVDMIAAGREKWLTAGFTAIEGGERLKLETLTLRAPIPVPPSMRDFSTFEQHIRSAARERGLEVRRQWYDFPAFWFMSPTSVCGPTDDVEVTPGSMNYDFELEIAAVIGVPGRDIDVSEAENHIAGFMLMNDWTARDVVGHDIRVGLGPAKGKDTATTFGPWLVTADEFEHLRRGAHWDISVSVAVNGREIGRDSAANMYWTFAELVAYASRGAKLVPGDILGSGPTGFGCLKEVRFERGGESHPWLAPGDLVEISGTHLGRQVSRIVPGREPLPIRPPARDVAMAAIDIKQAEIRR